MPELLSQHVLLQPKLLHVCQAMFLAELENILVSEVPVHIAPVLNALSMPRKKNVETASKHMKLSIYSELEFFPLQICLGFVFNCSVTQ